MVSEPQCGCDLLLDLAEVRVVAVGSIGLAGGVGAACASLRVGLLRRCWYCCGPFLLGLLLASALRLPCDQVLQLVDYFRGHCCDLFWLRW